MKVNPQRAGGATGQSARGSSIFIDDLGADPSGSTSPASVAANHAAWKDAYRAALVQIGTPASPGPRPGGVNVEFGPGTYTFGVNSLELTHPQIGIRGQGKGVTVIQLTGSGTSAKPATGLYAGNPGGLPGHAAPLVDFTLTGWQAGPHVNGLRYGDRPYARLELAVVGFVAGGSQNILMRNDANTPWGSEGITARIHTSAGGACLVTFDGMNQNGSFDYSDWWFHVVEGSSVVTPGFVLCRVINQAHITGGSLTLLGNINAADNSPATVLQVGASATDSATLNNVDLQVVVEANQGNVLDLVVNAGTSSDGHVGGISQCLGRYSVFSYGGTAVAGRVGGGTFHASMTGVLQAPIFKTGRRSQLGGFSGWDAGTHAE